MMLDLGGGVQVPRVIDKTRHGYDSIMESKLNPADKALNPEANDIFKLVQGKFLDEI